MNPITAAINAVSNLGSTLLKNNQAKYAAVVGTNQQLADYTASQDLGFIGAYTAQTNAQAATNYQNIAIYLVIGIIVVALLIMILR